MQKEIKLVAFQKFILSANRFAKKSPRMYVQIDAWLISEMIINMQHALKVAFPLFFRVVRIFREEKKMPTLSHRWFVCPTESLQYVHRPVRRHTGYCAGSSIDNKKNP